MLPEDKLDSLLSARAHGSSPMDEDAGELQSLVDVADRLTRMGQAQPEPDFAAELHGDLMARVALLREERALAASGPIVQPYTGQYAPTIPLSLHASDARTTPIRRWDDGALDPTIADLPEAPRRSTTRRTRVSRSRVFWQGIAAAVVLLVCGGTLSVAAFANPGSPLYALRQLEGHVGVPSAPSAADRARQQLSAANNALTALTAVVTQHGGDAAYAQALASLRTDEATAANTLNSLTPSDRAQLLPQLQDLQARERSALHGALAQVGWDNRLATTQALGDLGETIPQITSAVATQVTTDGGSFWRVELRGSGFAPGAALVINGQRVDVVSDGSATTLSATIEASAIGGQPITLGVVNPDGGAAQTTQVNAQTGTGDQPTPGTEPTATPGDNHNGDSGGGDHSGTPTPTPGPSK